MTRRTHLRPMAVVASAIAALVTMHRLGTSYGSTREERKRTLPGDDLVSCPQTVATHARTIEAPPEAVWPWLTQVGWHRGGWYTPRWVDVLLFPGNRPSATHLLAGHRDLSVGDFIPDGPPSTECGFLVRDVQHAQHLVLSSTTHLPRSWRRRGLRINWTWSFVLTPIDGGRATRLVFRWRGRTHPWWLTAGFHLVIVPADFVMSRGMLRGLASRAEARHDLQGPQNDMRRAS